MAEAPTPVAAAEAVLQICVQTAGVEGGRVLLLDLKTGHYVPFAPAVTGASASVATPAAGSLDVPPEHVMSLSDFETAADVPGAEVGSVLFGYRGQSCVGAITLPGLAPDALDASLRRELVDIASLLVPIYEDQFAFNLLASLQDPLDFQQPEDEFLREISMLVALASGMEFVVLWESGEATMRCIAAWGLDDDDDDDARRWDIDSPERFRPMAKALAGETVVFEGGDAGDPVWLPALPALGPVRSYVLMPIQIGATVFGVLGVGARCPFHYAPLELHGFESIANGIGVSIANYRSSHKLSSRVREYTETAVAITAIEVAQAARHEAAGLLDNCQSILAGLERKLGRHLPLIEADLDDISGELAQIMEALDRIKSATRPPERTKQRIGIEQLWKEARTAVSGRLNDLRIVTDYTGPDVEVNASPDWLRQVFLNLLLNSIDAFREAKKQGRRIELSAERPAPRANSYELTYRDNATGINPQRLRVPPEQAGLPVAQLIFEPSVTSKRDGSGFGLWLVRRILDDINGSIDLKDHRVGVTFALRIPKPPDAKST